MVKKLDEIRLGHDSRKAAAAYAEAFSGYGVDVLALEPEEAASRLKTRAVRSDLAAALDDWAALADKAADRRQLLAVVRLIDPDPLRPRLREALGKKDARALRDLASAKEALEQPPGLLVRLARGLSDAGSAAEAAALLKAAQRRHPGDFGVNSLLA